VTVISASNSCQNVAKIKFKRRRLGRLCAIGLAVMWETASCLSKAGRLVAFGELLCLGRSQLLVRLGGATAAAKLLSRSGWPKQRSTCRSEG
jgi:hypothetical protein